MSINELKILGVAGSMREGSYSKRALKVALESAKKHGAQVRMLELAKADLPMYASSGASSSPALAKVAADVEWADAFILASPDFHGSISGALKNFLDYFYEEFAGKVFGYIVASHEKGLTVMDQMRTAVRQCYGWSMPYGVSINGEQDFSAGQLSNPRIEQRLNMMGRDLVTYGRLIRGQFLQDLAGSDSETFAARYR
ncbi:NADPH-dependent FMN reductase [Nitrososphaera viennensis]|uniref:NAD(P)H-dependent oxidoreductase n=2 Tax=Nitrososphaera viennensis TaxID=1034015 RepID=A0A977ICU8_9ARCH|nr:NAD(P)H-dependent oxidoreductase [Nitrososphaera viennensis]AIC16494.1 putative NADPH-dependent FMN reductase [Nitrososphaera viennensis EN76]UVS68427.1 NAD(P)H-dependent oxidoreductase [Nitrososphaera viennensis]